MTQSLSFDRAVSFYDATRGFPADVAARVGESVVEVVGAGARVLEIGIGTGRIAKPMLSNRLRVDGVDLSRGMMTRLLETLPAGLPVPSLQQADARCLPFRSGLYDAVVAVHVFHLIDNWRAALAETLRVLRPGGAVLIGYEWSPPDCLERLIRKRWRAIVKTYGASADGPSGLDVQPVRTALLERGATRDERLVAEWTTPSTIKTEIESIEQRLWSSTWRVPEEIVPATASDLRAWATDEYGSLDLQFDTPSRFIWEVFGLVPGTHV